MKELTTRTDLSALNDQQRKAVLSRAKRLLVLAGAGSGKTKTLLQKINYLLDDEQVDAKSILAITFTKNAANEMVDRMILSADSSGYYEKFLNTKGITASDRYKERQKFLDKCPWLRQLTIKTIHSLCYQIIKQDGVKVFDNKFKIVGDTRANNEFGSTTAEETVREITEKVSIQLCEDNLFLLQLKRYILDYYVDHIHKDKEQNEFRPEGKFFTSLKGDKVRSKSEQYIADWLFRNSIDYVYEPEFKVEGASFRPDFYIPTANVYLEHLSDLSYPSFWKEEKMRQTGATCIKTYDKATHNSAVFNSVLDRVIKGRISDDLNSAMVLHYAEEFSNFKMELKKFYRDVIEVKDKLVNSEKTINEVGQEAAASPHERVRLFYELAIPIIKAFYNYCTDRSYLDFDGLLTYSIQLMEEHPEIRDRYQERYDYILVDEFQDVNNLQVKLLKLLTKQETQLFCVGDDWQSIYGFRGSEIDYIVNFKEHFKDSELITLNLNYRSTDPIVNASAEAIKKNKFQIPKEIKAVKKGGRKIEVFYEEEEGQTKSFIWETIHKHLSEGVSPEQILVLFRRTSMKENLDIEFEKSGLKVHFETIHGAKGLEAKVVFVLGLHSNRGGFPDPWLQDKIYQVIKPTDYDYLLEEERRLFYVALTRAEDHLYLISQKGAVSEFVKDLPSEYLEYGGEPSKPMVEKLLLCSTCDSKLEEHYHYCPECGCAVESEKETMLVDDNLTKLKEKIEAIPIVKETDINEYISKVRQNYHRAYEPWSEEEDSLLLEYQEYPVKVLSQIFGRGRGGIKARIEHLTKTKKD